MSHGFHAFSHDIKWNEYTAQEAHAKCDNIYEGGQDIFFGDKCTKKEGKSKTDQKQGQTVEHIIWHLWRLEKCFPVKEESRDPCCKHPDGASDCQISQCKLQVLASDGHSRAKDSLLQIRLMECDHDQSHYITQYGD